MPPARHRRTAATWLGVFAVLFAALAPLGSAVRAATFESTNPAETIVICTPTGFQTIHLAATENDREERPANTRLSCPCCLPFSTHFSALTPGAPALPLRISVPASPPTVDRQIDAVDRTHHRPPQPRGPPILA
jgi:hypothetical protein